MIFTSEERKDFLDCAGDGISRSFKYDITKGYESVISQGFRVVGFRYKAYVSMIEILGIAFIIENIKDGFSGVFVSSALEGLVEKSR